MPFSRNDLHGYQEQMITFIKEHPKGALWVDMGLGKTVSTLTALDELMREFEVIRVLVTAPLRVALTTWPDEIKRWAHLRHLTARVIQGTPTQRARIVRTDRSDIHLINRELVPWLIEQMQLPAFCPYDTLVIDESSSFKDQSTKRFKSLRRLTRSINRVIELTGTPAPNGLLGLWAQIFLLDQGERLGRTWTGFRETYFTPDYHGYKWTPREGTDTRIQNKLKDICLTLSAEDYLKMPDRIDRTVSVALPDEARPMYAALEREFLLELQNDVVEAATAAVLTNKLLQFANGALYTGPNGAYTEVHDAKLDALEDLIEAAQGPVLVAYNFKSDVERIKARFPKAEPIGKDPATIKRWNAGKIPILLAHPASAGHGLNLQAGGATIIWFGLNWSLELYQQFNARLHRQGQTRPVIVHHIVTADTVDETVVQALSGKHTTQKALIDALKTQIGARVIDERKAA